MAQSDERVDEFIEAACVPLEGSHVSGTLERAEAIRTAHPEIASSSIYTAAILGDDAAVSWFLGEDPRDATEKGGPRGWDALTYLCFSRYLRLDPARSDGFVRAAEALLDAGASPNTGWFEPHHQPEPEWESAIYGAAGVAHHAPLTRLLLERGADPNDGETPYHAPEGYDNAALKVLVESGTLNEDSQTTILLRKTDWHDLDGIRWLLAQGIDANRMTRWGNTPLQHAMLRDNCLEIIDELADHGADPLFVAEGPDQPSGRTPTRSALSLAVRRGRGDVLASFERRGIPMELAGLERLITACARNDQEGIRSRVDSEPELVRELLAEGGTLLAEFAGNGNSEGAGHLLDLGVRVGALYEKGDCYFGVAPRSTALHVAAWRARHATVRFLIERGAQVDALDGQDHTPLQLAVKACVDSYWSNRRSPESVEALLGAGASADGIVIPTGYAEVDELLRAHWSNP
jgi:ankyrin repeat protein